MIPVTPAPEAPEFDELVRQPGLSAIDEMVGRKPRIKRRGPKRKALVKNGAAITQEQDIPAEAFPTYWTKSLPKMLEAYDRRCAYLAMYIHHATGNPSVDHILPKSHVWDQVYEWSNYRLCAAIVNAKKGELQTLVDPFEIDSGWFALNLLTSHVERGELAPQAQCSRIDDTLPILNHRLCVSERLEYLRCYALGPGAGGIDLTHLELRAPFIASELRRQGQLVRGDT